MKDSLAGGGSESDSPSSAESTVRIAGNLFRHGDGHGGGSGACGWHVVHSTPEPHHHDWQSRASLGYAQASASGFRVRVRVSLRRLPMRRLGETQAVMRRPRWRGSGIWCVNVRARARACLDDRESGATLLLVEVLFISLPVSPFLCLSSRGLWSLVVAC